MQQSVELKIHTVVIKNSKAQNVLLTAIVFKCSKRSILGSSGHLKRRSNFMMCTDCREACLPLVNSSE